MLKIFNYRNTKLLITFIISLVLFFNSIPSTSHVYNEKTENTPYTEYIQKVNPSIPISDAYNISRAVIRYSNEFNLDPKLLLAVARTESRFDKHAISSSGAYGIMQIIPVWHKEKIIVAKKELGNPEIFNIKTNIFLGAWVLKECKQRTSNINKALLCYSGQTSGYDKKVLQEYRKI